MKAFRMAACLIGACSLLTAQRGSQSDTFVNDRLMSQEQKRAFMEIYGLAPLPGRFWYDSRSGLWGLWGREPAGFLLPGHNYGPLPREASAGNTGILINGREVNDVEAMFIRRTFGAAYRGRWWLLANGNFGLEGSPWPTGNLGAALHRSGSPTETHVGHVGMHVNTSSTGCNSVFTSGGGGSIAAFPGC